jgi:hypothetical protein
MDGPAVLVAWLLLYPALSLFSSALVEAQAANILLTFKCICCKKREAQRTLGKFQTKFQDGALKSMYHLWNFAHMHHCKGRRARGKGKRRKDCTATGFQTSLSPDPFAGSI